MVASKTRLAPLALAAGCVLSPHSTSGTPDTTTTTTSGTDSAGTTSAAATDAPTTTMPIMSGTSAASTAGTTGGTTMCSLFDCDGSTSGFPTFECDLWEQNCPEGQKCMPWANDGSSAWNATKCTDIMPNAGKPGDLCSAEGGGVSGVDSCEKAAMCWNISQQTGKGTCIAFCMGSPEAPICPGGTHCVIGGNGELILCFPECDPLEQDCPNMDLCIADPMGDGFMCVHDDSGDMGQQNDPCGFPNACDPGLSCLPPSFAAECDPMAPGCCLPFCDLMDPTCTNQGATCIGWYEPDMAPPFLENVGICRLPP